jgi:subtilase family serine protease
MRTSSTNVTPLGALFLFALSVPLAACSASGGWEGHGDGFGPSSTCPGEQALSMNTTGDWTGATLVGPAPASMMLYLDIGLPERNTAQLDKYIQEISDPSSPEYGQSLTPTQFADMYGPTPSDYEGLTKFIEAQGFTDVMTYDNRLLLDFGGTVAQVEKTFCVTMNYYLRPDGTAAYAPAGTPSVNLAIPLDGISGLDDYQLPQPL